MAKEIIAFAEQFDEYLKHTKSTFSGHANALRFEQLPNILTKRLLFVCFYQSLFRLFQWNK